MVGHKKKSITTAIKMTLSLLDAVLQMLSRPVGIHGTPLMDEASLTVLGFYPGKGPKQSELLKIIADNQLKAFQAASKANPSVFKDIVLESGNIVPKKGMELVEYVFSVERKKIANRLGAEKSRLKKKEEFTKMEIQIKKVMTLLDCMRRDGLFDTAEGLLPLHHYTVGEKDNLLVKVSCTSIETRASLPTDEKGWFWLGFSSKYAVAYNKELNKVQVILQACSLGDAHVFTESDIDENTKFTSALMNNKTFFFVSNVGVTRLPLHAQMHGDVSATSETLSLIGGCTIAYLHSGNLLAIACQEGIVLWVACQARGIRSMVLLSFKKKYARPVAIPRYRLKSGKRVIPPLREQAPFTNASGGPIPAVTVTSPCKTENELAYQQGSTISVIQVDLFGIKPGKFHEPRILLSAATGTLLACVCLKMGYVISTTDNVVTGDTAQPMDACATSSFTSVGPTDADVYLWRDSVAYSFNAGTWVKVLMANDSEGPSSKRPRKEK